MNNIKPNNKDKQFMPNSAETVKPIVVINELAKIAGVGQGTIYRIKTIERETVSLNKSINLIDNLLIQ